MGAPLGPKSNLCCHIDLLGFRTCSGFQFRLPKLLNLTGSEFRLKIQGLGFTVVLSRINQGQKKLTMQFQLLKLPS